MILHQLRQCGLKNNGQLKYSKLQLFDHSETNQSRSNCQLANIFAGATSANQTSANQPLTWFTHALSLFFIFFN